MTDTGLDPGEGRRASAPPAVHAVYELTSADYRAATIELAQQSVTTTGAGAFMVGLTVIPLINADLSSLLVLAFGLSLLSGAYCLPFIWWAVRRRSDLLLSRQDFTADSVGIRVATSMTATEQTWATFRRIRELGQVFVLDYGTGANAMLPKRALDPETGERFRSLVRSVSRLEQPSRWGNLLRGLGLGLLVAAAYTALLIVLNN